MRDLPEFERIEARRFREEIAPAGRPCVLRGIAAHWPVVRAGRSSPAAFAAYLKRFDQGRPVETWLGPPEIAGRFFYDQTVSGFNFERRPQPIAETLERLIGRSDRRGAASLYSGSIPIPQHLPGFESENRLDLVPAEVPPRLWIGGETSVAPHFDLSDNIACVAAGRRRFTLFPPEQVSNLYVGPLEHTVAGQPISLVDVDTPDFDRFPRFALALEAAQTAVLEPGDAVYIPALWWHAVRALEPVNALVNWWWDGRPDSAAGFEALIHAILGVREAPTHQRAAWRALFEHYVFSGGETAAPYLPPARRGILGPLTPELRRRIKAFLQRGLMRA